MIFRTLSMVFYIMVILLAVHQDAVLKRQVLDLNPECWSPILKHGRGGNMVSAGSLHLPLASRPLQEICLSEGVPKSTAKHG